MTIRLYAARKGWAVTDVHVRLSGGRVEDTFQISEQLTLVGDLNEEQRQRLLEIATRCPVHRTLRGKVAIDAIEMSA
jgi:putative redox protein